MFKVIEPLNKRHWEVASILPQYVNQLHRGEWDAWTSYVLFAVNKAKHNMTQQNSFFVMFLQDVIIPEQNAMEQRTIYDSDSSYKSGMLMRSRGIFQRLNSKIIAGGFKQKQQYDKNVHFKPYNPGDVVYLSVQLSGK